MDRKKLRSSLAVKTFCKKSQIVENKTTKSKIESFQSLLQTSYRAFSGNHNEKLTLTAVNFFLSDQRGTQITKVLSSHLPEFDHYV